MTATGLHLVVDARMIDHSGIGVYLNTLLEGIQDLIVEDPDLESRLVFTFLGRQSLFTRKLPPAINDSARRIAFNAPLYSLAEQLNAAGRIRDATHIGGNAGPRSRAADGPLVFWPHYNFPLRWRGPMVVTVHDLIHTQYPTRKGTRLYQNYMLGALRRRLRRADRGGPPVHVLTDSRHVKVLLQRVWKFPPHRVWNVGVALPPGFRPPRNEDEFRAAMAGALATPSALGATAAPAPRLPKRYWLTVGLFKPHKNHAWLLEQLGRYWSVGEFKDMQLVMAGAHENADLLRLIDADSQLRGRVKILPVLTDEQLRAVYWGAEALLFPSLTEGFGLPVLEAMACGTPVICSRRAPMTEFAADVAWFFDPTRPADGRPNANGKPDELLQALRAISSPPGTANSSQQIPASSAPASASAPGFAPSSVAQASVSESVLSSVSMSVSAAARSPEDDIDARLRRGIARAREFAPAALARRVLDVWTRATGEKTTR